MKTRLISLIRKEFIQTFRDAPIVILVIYMFAEIALCGWALTMEVKHVSTAVLDRDNSPASRALLEHLRQTDAFTLDFYPSSEDEVEQLLDSSQATLGLIIPSGLGRDLAGGRPTSIQVLADGTRPNEALLALSYINQIVLGYSANIEMERLNSSGQNLNGMPRVVNNIRSWYLPGLRYVNFVMVSMVTLSIIMVGMLLAAAGIVREKENGTMEQLMVTPISPAELIFAKIVPMILMEVVGLLIGIAISYFIFGVSPHGHPVRTLLLFIALSMLALLASAGIGILIATYARNMMQALLLTFFVLFPAMFLSGSLTPVTAMPVWLQRIAYVNPITHYLTLSLGVFLKGVGLGVVWPHVAILGGFTVLISWFALRRFRRSLV